MDDAQDKPYTVGYGKPPDATRFTKGRSGNPKGRPKGSRGLATIILQEGKQRVKINGPRGTRTTTKSHAVIMQLANQAAKGNLAATRTFIALTQAAEQASQKDAQAMPLLEIDSIVMQGIIARIRGLEAATEQSTEPIPAEDPE